MDMVNSVAELANEFYVVDTLVAEVRRIVIESKTLMAIDSRNGPLSGSNVESNFCRMYFKSEVNIGFVKRFKNRQPSFCKILKPAG